MKRSSWCPLAFLAVSILIAPFSTARAAISFSGDVSPSDSSGWADCTYGYVGRTAAGTLTVDSGDDVVSRYGCIGNNAGVTGVVTVDGAGSTWTNGEYLEVGGSGTGILNIMGGASVSAGSGTTYVGRYSGSSGTINFGPGGGTLTSWRLFAAANQLTGTGTLNVNGLVSDMDVVFDSAHGLSQTFTMNNGAITVNLDMSSSPNDLGVGNRGNGSLAIRNGLVIGCAYSYLGYQAGSMGVATVDGSGSTWVSSIAAVGYLGNGAINVVNGGSISNDFGYIGERVGSTGTATVDGSGSVWTNSYRLCVGGQGAGVLNVTGGASVSSSSAYIGGCITVALSGAGTATVSGSDSTWTNTQDLYVGYSGTGVLSILNGGSVSSRNGFVGGFEHSVGTGTVTVSGSGSTWTNTGQLGIGYLGTGTLTIDGGAIVRSAGGGVNSSVATIDGQGSKWISNGVFSVDCHSDATATLNITNGGGLSSTSGFIGSYWNASTAVTVSGSSTWTNNGSLEVSAHMGTATLAISSGGTVTNASNADIGYDSGVSMVTVDGAGSTWLSGDTVTVGRHGPGTLNVTNGGNVHCNNMLYIGYDYGGVVNVTNGGSISSSSCSARSVGTVTIDGVGSTWVDSGGLSGSGTLAIANGGLLCVNGISCGVVNFRGGTWKPYDANATLSSGVAYVHEGGARFDTDGHDMSVSIPVRHGGSNSVDGGITKLGDGILRFSGTNTYTGTTTVADGVLIAQRSASLPGYDVLGRVVVQSGAAVGWAVQGQINPTAVNALLNNATWADDGTSSIAFETNNQTSAGYGGVLGNPAGKSIGLLKLGTGSLVLAGANSYTGTTTVKAGVLTLVGLSTATPVAWSPVLNGGGADVQGGQLVFNYAGGTSPGAGYYSTINTLLTNSYHGALWDRGQFLCTTKDGSHGLGWVDNGTDKVTVMYTLYGDANCDGSVSGTDLNAVLSFYNQSHETWQHGDFNYDGSINGTDLNSVLSNYNRSLPSSTAAVPEPAGVFMLIAIALAGLGWFARAK